jgi:hypothetical protein
MWNKKIDKNYCLQFFEVMATVHILHRVETPKMFFQPP